MFEISISLLFPLILQYAVSINTSEEITIDKVIIDIISELAVILGPVQLRVDCMAQTLVYARGSAPTIDFKTK